MKTIEFKCTSECKYIKRGATCVFHGGNILLSESSGACAFMIEQITPLLEAIEQGIDPLEYGIDINHGKFSCEREGCHASFSVQPYRIVEKGAGTTLDPSSLPSSEATLMQMLDHETASVIIDASSEVKFLKDDIIIKEGDVNDSLFIIGEGHVKVVKDISHGDPKPVAIIGPGNCFGEMSLLTSDVCSASVVAAEEVIVWKIRSDKLDQVMSEKPELHKRFTQVFSQRLRKNYNSLAEKLTRGITGRLNMISATEIVQALYLSQRTGVLNINGSAGDAGSIFFNKGQIRASFCGETAGPEAFYTVISWKDGDFCFSASSNDNLDANINMDTMNLLLEAAKRMDDAQNV